MSYVGPITKEIIEMCTNEIKKKENKEKIYKYIINPILQELFNRYSLYVSIFFIIQILILSLLIYVVIHIKNKN